MTFADQRQPLIRVLRKKPGRDPFPEPVDVGGRVRLFELGQLAGWMAKVEGQPAEQLLRTRAELVPYQWHLHRSLEAARRAFEGPHVRRLALVIAVIDSAMTPEDRDVLVAVTPDASNLLVMLQDVVKATGVGSGQLADVVAVAFRNLGGDSEVVRRLMGTIHLLMTVDIELVRLAESPLERLPDGETDEGGVMSTSESLSMMVKVVCQPAPSSSVLELASEGAVTTIHHLPGHTEPLPPVGEMVTHDD